MARPSLAHVAPRSRGGAALAALAALAACGGAPPAGPGPAPAPAAPAAPAPTSPGAAEGVPVRLPRAFAPARYAVRLAIDPARDDFAGSVQIEGTLAAPAAALWLHASGLAITRAVARRGATEVALVATPHPGERLQLRAAAPLAAGTWTLELAYTGALDLVSTAGAFKQTVGGAAYVYTQLEAIYARRVVPCLDEPDVKVPWQLTLDVPERLVAVANTPVAREAALGGGVRRVEFAPSKPMPSYLLAFGVGPFDVVDAGRTAGGTPVRVIALAGRRADAAHAARTVTRLVDLAEAWFATPYPYEKLDLLAIPLTVGFGAMENAGLITFVETLLLLPPDASEQRRLWWATVAAHEIAHQWFGNLVTMAFWDDIWLNEGFANWLEARLAGALEPAWRVEDGDLRTRNQALEADALVTARRVREPIARADDILNVFDGITYDKGASVLAMFESYLGPEVFQRGVRAYLAARAWGNASSPDFVDALGRAAGQDLAPAFATFLDQPGAPELTASVACGARPTVALAQRHYVPPGAPAPATTRPWIVPVCAAYERGGARQEACTLLDGPTGTLALPAGACPRWVLPNARGRGYYRVAYTAAQVAALRDEAWAALTPLERRAIAFDVAAGARTGALPLALALSFVPRLLALGDRFAVEEALALAGELEPVVPAALRERYEAWLRATFGPAALAAGLTPGPRDSLDVEASRELLVATVAGVGREPTLRARAVELAARGWRALPQATRGAVIAIAADADAGVFAQLVRDVDTETDRGRRGELFAALGGVRDPAKLDQALALLLEPRVDIRESVGLLWSLADDDARLRAQAFVRRHLPALLARMPADGTSDQASDLAHLFATPCRAEARAETVAFLARAFGHLPGSARVLAQVGEDLDQCIARRAALEPQVRAWLGGLKLPTP